MAARALVAAPAGDAVPRDAASHRADAGHQCRGRGVPAMSLAAEQSLTSSPGALSRGLRSWRPRRYVMCPPIHFTVSYCINPWMDPDQPVDAGRALRQWQDLHETLSALGHHITLVEAHPELPDMVFAANGGILIGDRALVPRFRFVVCVGVFV